MNYRKFTADKVFDGMRFLDKDNVVIVDDDGRISDVVTIKEAGEHVERLNGILMPGLINSHCHLELSHMKDVIPPGTGLVDFLISVVGKRGGQSEDNIRQKAAEAEREMFNNGIVAVGDIANTEYGITTKQQSQMTWYNFIEVLNFFDRTLPERLAHNQNVLDQHKALPYQSILTPHAPYSVSPATFQALNDATEGQTISIHNEETPAEKELFESGGGDFLRLYQFVKFEEMPVKKSGRTSLQTYLPYFTKGQTIILVHNTFITEEDILFAAEHADKHNLRIVYCLCPNANLYIENTLPPVDLLLKHGCALLIGTDSYSSNWELSIASELKTINDHFPHLSLETLLNWATANAAACFGWNHLGKIEKGKTPGLALLDTDTTGRLIGTSRRIA
jgi:aminodeoxyfutalosine deaminase